MPSPTTQDFIAGYDPTGHGSISDANLLAMIQAGKPFTNVGLVLTTVDVGNTIYAPDATGTPKWQAYLWRRVGAIAVTLYVWDPNTPFNAITLYWKVVSVQLNSSVGRTILQQQYVTDTTAINTTSNLATVTSYASSPLITDGIAIPNLAYNFTPIAAGSTVEVEINAYFYAKWITGTIPLVAIVSLYQNASANAVACGVVTVPAWTTGSDPFTPSRLLYRFQPVNTTLIAFTVRFGCMVAQSSDTDSFKYNGRQNNVLGGVAPSWIKLTEIV